MLIDIDKIQILRCIFSIDLCRIRQLVDSTPLLRSKSKNTLFNVGSWKNLILVILSCKTLNSSISIFAQFAHAPVQRDHYEPGACFGAPWERGTHFQDIQMNKLRVGQTWWSRYQVPTLEQRWQLQAERVDLTPEPELDTTGKVIRASHSSNSIYPFIYYDDAYIFEYLLIVGAWLSEWLRRWSNESDVVGSIPVTMNFSKFHVILIRSLSGSEPTLIWRSHYNISKMVL